MEGIKVACGQITWRGSGFSQEQILQQIAEAGYDGAPVPASSLEDVPTVRQWFDAAGLSPAPAYLGAEFWDASQADNIVRKADDIAQVSRELGLTEVYMAASLTPERRAVSGHVTPSDALSANAYDVFARTLNRAGEVTLRQGVRASSQSIVTRVLTGMSASFESWPIACRSFIRSALLILCSLSRMPEMFNALLRLQFSWRAQDAGRRGGDRPRAQRSHRPCPRSSTALSLTAAIRNAHSRMPAITGRSAAIRPGRRRRCDGSSLDSSGGIQRRRQWEQVASSSIMVGPHNHHGTTTSAPVGSARRTHTGAGHPHHDQTSFSLSH